MNYFEKIRAIQSFKKNHLHNDDYYTLDRKKRIDIFRLKTGHIRLSKHLPRLHCLVLLLFTCVQDE